MNLNYTAFLLIAFVPLLIAVAWYHPHSPMLKWSGVAINPPTQLSIGKCLLAFVLSFGLTYGYINLIIHQMGFYELFFTDIMTGKEGAKEVVQEFLGKYGDKHRHLGHGVFHGAINAFVLALPFVGLQALLEEKSLKYVLLHFSYWLITSMIIGGLISEFV